MKRLFIAEKPSLAEAIVDGFGKNAGFKKTNGWFENDTDVITWCFGHMIELCEPQEYENGTDKWSLDTLPFTHLPVKKRVKKSASKQVSVIKKLLARSDISTIVNAGDPDEEGQLLVDELILFFNCKKPVKRILINDNNSKIVAKAIANLQDNKDYEHLGWKAEARSVADWHYGLNLTRLYSLLSNGNGVFSVGRVQTPILYLVEMRCQANKTHKKTYYYNIESDFDIDGLLFNGKYQPTSKDPINDKNLLIDENFAKKLAESCKGEKAKITDIETTEKSAPPPLPFNLLKLQQEASKRYGIKPKSLDKIAQSLYEKHKLITYVRSDSQYLSDEQFDDVSSVLFSISKTAPQLQSLIKQCDKTIKSRAFNSSKVSAHHAIVPTEAIADLNKLSPNEQKVYLLIANAYILQFFPNYEYDSTKVTIDVNGNTFKTNSKVDKTLGWKSLNTEEDDTEEVIALDLRNLETGNSGLCLDTKVSKAETKPPPLYTMNTLLGDLTKVSKYVKDPRLAKILKDKDKDKAGENGGIGTPATRSAIIDNLFSRGFIAEEKKKIITTDTGSRFCAVLEDIIKYPDMTAIWHEQQKNISNQANVHQFVNNMMDKVVNPLVNDLKTKGTNSIELVDTFKCDKCDRPMVRRKGSKGYFWGCTGYNDETNPCKNIMDDVKGKPVKRKKSDTKVILSDYDCAVCNSKLNQISGKSKKTKKPYTLYACTNENCNQSYFPNSDGSPNYK